MDMNDTAKLTRAVRINVIGGTVFLGVAALTFVLVVAGVLPLGTQLVVLLVFGFVMAGLMFLTARSLRQDREDPAGIERRFQSQAVSWSAALLAVGLVAVIGVIAWGLLR
jgi:hypothetical protein